MHSHEGGEECRAAEKREKASYGVPNTRVDVEASGALSRDGGLV